MDNNEHAILFWNSTRCLRSAVNEALDEVDYGDLKPSIDYQAALRRTAKHIAKDILMIDEPIKLFGLSGHASDVAVEVRKYDKGERRNDLQFLISLGITSDYRLVVLDNSLDLPTLGKEDLERKGNQVLQDELKYCEAADVTESIAELVKKRNGFMLRDGGGVWYSPVDMLGPYETVAKRLREHGVLLNCVRFYSKSNDELLHNVSDTLVKRAESVINSTVDDVATMVKSCKRIKPQGHATRSIRIMRVQRMVEANSKLLGNRVTCASQGVEDWSTAFEQACTRALVLVDEASTGKFAVPVSEGR